MAALVPDPLPMPPPPRNSAASAIENVLYDYNRFYGSGNGSDGGNEMSFNEFKMFIYREYFIFCRMTGMEDEEISNQYSVDSLAADINAYITHEDTDWMLFDALVEKLGAATNDANPTNATFAAMSATNPMGVINDKFADFFVNFDEYVYDH